MTTHHITFEDICDFEFFVIVQFQPVVYNIFTPQKHSTPVHDDDIQKSLPLKILSSSCQQ